MNLALYVFFFFSWAYINYKAHGLNTSTFLLVIYLLSAFASNIVYYLYPGSIKIEEISLISISSHLLLLFLFMFPIIRLGNLLTINIFQNTLNKVNYKYLFTFLIVTGLVAIIICIPKVIAIFAIGNFGDARGLVLDDNFDMGFYRYGFVGILGIAGCYISFFSLFFSFYLLFIRNKCNIIFYLLLITSFTIVVVNLSIAGRDGLLQWMLFLSFCIVFYRKKITLHKIPKYLAIIITLCVIFTTFLFIKISVDRFGENTGDLIFTWLNYLGQSFYYYSYFFNYVGTDGQYGIEAIIPILSFKASVSSLAGMNQIYYPFPVNVFSTFVGSFILKTGYFTTLIVALFFFLLTISIKRKNIKNSIPKLILYLTVYQIIMLGVFYYMFPTKSSHLTFIFIYFIVYMSENKRKTKL